MNIVTAMNYLKQRYAEICLKFPQFAEYITEDQYLSVNLPHTLRNQREGYGHWAKETRDTGGEK